MNKINYKCPWYIIFDISRNCHHVQLLVRLENPVENWSIYPKNGIFGKIDTMYIPGSNLMSDKAETIAFMKRFSFATIITSRNNLPVATHLPFTVTLREEEIVLSSHFAKANPQWKDIEDNTVLVIFSEPHAYISPTNYDKQQNVPTWDYVSVHSYGKGRLITDPEKVMSLLEATIQNYEQDYLQQWESLSSKYKTGMMHGIVGFEIIVTDLQGKKKLSQGNSKNEQQKIVDTLSKSADTNERIIADYMRQNLKDE